MQQELQFITVLPIDFKMSLYRSKTMETQEELIELLEDLDKARDNSKEPLSLQERYERACKEQLFQEVQQSYVMYDCDQVDKWNQEVQEKKKRLAKQILYLRSELEKLRMHLLEKEPPQEIKEEVLLEVEEINERVKQLEEERNKWEKYDEDFEAQRAKRKKVLENKLSAMREELENARELKAMLRNKLDGMKHEKANDNKEDGNENARNLMGQWTKIFGYKTRMVLILFVLLLAAMFLIITFKSYGPCYTLIELDLYSLWASPENNFLQYFDLYHVTPPAY
ncbi:trichohyalin-like [Protopterus annectens]|uniref:trichohyalin-like n=1 Tax=Protopterus annectens TaxID=7888 RepID=UPI001CF93939|nr:trichohyalin-like [Protopterus annectens]